jgi:nicotinamidase/pyrazinamidase
MKNIEFSDYQRLTLIDVDVQNDFCPGGSLAVSEGDLVIPALNKGWRAIKSVAEGRVRSYPYAYREDLDYKEPTAFLTATRDWHPKKTNHFGAPPDFIKTWPVHCVANTEGAGFHPDLDLRDAVTLSKGTLPDQDAYSGFQAHDNFNEGLEQLIGNPELLKIAVFVGGLATDYCVKATVLDARQRGYDTFVLSDAIRGVSQETSAQAVDDMTSAGARFMSVDELVEALR